MNCLFLSEANMTEVEVRGRAEGLKLCAKLKRVGHVWSYGDVLELADKLVSKTSAVMRMGSNPIVATICGIGGIGRHI